MVDVTTSVLLEPVRLWSAPARLLAEGRWDEESQAVARGSHPRVARIPHQLTERRHPGAVSDGRGGHEAQRRWKSMVFSNPVHLLGSHQPRLKSVVTITHVTVRSGAYQHHVFILGMCGGGRGTDLSTLGLPLGADGDDLVVGFFLRPLPAQVRRKPRSAPAGRCLRCIALRALVQDEG